MRFGTRPAPLDALTLVGRCRYGPPVRLITTCLVLLAWSFASPSSAQQTVMRPADRAVLRIVSVRGETQYGIGTGFFVDASGTAVTAAHVVAGARVLFGISAATGQAFPIAVAALDTGTDVAVLRVPPGVAPSSIASGERSFTVSAGDEVSISGYSGGELRELAPAVSIGHVSRTLSDGSLELSATVNPGQSGGPVLTSSGELLGLLSARIDPQSGVIGVALIQPRSAIAALVSRAPTFRVAAAPTLARLLAFGASAVTLSSLTTSDLDSALAEATTPHERATALLAGLRYVDSPDTADPALLGSLHERTTALIRSYPHLLVLYPSLVRALPEGPR